MTAPGAGHNGIDEKSLFDRFCQLYRERFENDESLADLSKEGKAARYDDLAGLKAEAQEYVNPDKRMKREAKDRKREDLRARLGIE